MSNGVSFRTERDWMETVGLNEGGLISLIQNLPIGFMIQGTQTEILFSNRAAQDMLGLSESQLLGESSCAPQWDVIHEDGTPFPSETHPAARAAATGQPVRNVVMGVCRPSLQDRVWLLMNADPRLAPDGSLRCVVCTFTDISERKRAEEALLESRQRHEELLRSIDGIVWECDPQTFAFTFVTEQAERMLGYPRERWLSEPTFWQDHLHPQDRDAALAFCLKATADLQPHQLEYRMIAADGRAVWLRDITSVVAQDGRPVRSRGILVDVTEFKRAQEALRQSDALNRHIVGSSTDCIKILDLEGNLLYVNRFGQQALQIEDLSTCLGKPWLDFCSGMDLQAARSAIATAKAGGTGTLESYCLISRGNPSWWHIVVTPMRDVEGNVERLLAVSRDITESKRGEEALRESEERIRAILRAMPDLMFLVDGEQVIVDYHARDRSDLFVPPEHFLGKKVEDVLPAPVSQGLRRCFEGAAKSSDPILFEYSLPLGGADFFFEARVVACAGNRFLSIVRNFTERKRAEESLRQSEEKNRAILKAIPDLMFLLDKEGVYLDYHAKDERQLLVPPEKFVGHNIRDVLPPELAEALAPCFARALQSGETQVLEYTLSIFGEERNFEARVVPCGQDKLLSLVRDITEGKRAEQALRNLVAGTAAVTGEEFFPALVRHVAAALDAHCAAVTQAVDGERDRLRILAMWVGRDWVGNFEYDVNHTPCGEVMRERKTCYYPNHVQELFREDGFLADLEAASYMGTPLLNSSGEPIGHLCVIDKKPLTGEQRARSILEIFAGRAAAELQRKQAEEALRESQRRYALASAAGRVGVWDWNLDTNEIYVEPLLKCILGYEDHEIRNHMDDWSRLLHPDDVQRVSAELRECLEGHTLHFESEHRMLHKDGDFRWLLARGLARRDETGRLSRISGTDTEITEQKRMREVLRETEVLKQAVLNSLQHNIAVLDQKGTIVTVNEVWNGFALDNGATSLAGIGVGVNYLDVCQRVAGEYALEALNGIQAVLNGAKETFAMEYYCPSLAEDRWFLMSVAPLKRSEGGAVVSHTNITERKRADEIVRQSRRELQLLTGRLISAQEEERRRLARELHDDFSQALAVLAIDAGKLERQGHALPDGIRQMLGKLKDQIVRLSSGIHGLSRQLHPSILDDLGLVDAIRSECLHVSKREGVPVEFTPGTVPDVLPREVSLCLYRVTQEGLRNIAKHARARHAEISLGQDNGGLRLIIQDDGLGFDPAQLRRKAGLGLASMRERVRMLEAELLVYSEPGRGTRLEVSIPLERTKAATAQ
jgi:PAS domain S-box-containing protein